MLTPKMLNLGNLIVFEEIFANLMCLCDICEKWNEFYAKMYKNV